MNPVHPFEWALIYADGSLFKRVCRGRVRTVSQAPPNPIAMRVSCGVGYFRIAAPERIKSVVARARVAPPIGSPSASVIEHWRFGFMSDEGFVGMIFNSDGTIEKRPHVAQ